MKSSKVLFLVFLSLLSLCAVSIRSVKAQTYDYILIRSDGSIITSTNATVPIQQVGNVYTFNGSMTGYSIIVQRDNIVVDGAGYILQGAGNRPGVDLSYRSNVTISNMQIGGFYYGVYLWKSLGNTINKNDIANVMNGISIENASNNNIISANNVRSSVTGISIYSSSNNELRNNTMNNAYNLAVYGTELSHFVNDVDISNTVNGKKVYYLVGQSDLVINPSSFPDLGFLALVNCTNIVVQNQEIANNGQGLLVAFTTGATITHNTITSNSVGVGFFASYGNSISGNTITKNARGIQFSKASRSNSVSANNITYNNNGIYFFESPQNTITGNNITNSEVGIGFSASSNNMIYNNKFISNTKQVHDSNMDDASVAPSVNYWDFGYPLGGNYWSDYTGVDAKSGENQDQPGIDGIGDTPYIIYGNNKDNYPLMPYGSRPAVSIISPENKTYTTSNVSLSFTVSKPTSWIGYSLDGHENVTITENATLSGLLDGLHSLIVYANDTDGKTGSSQTVYFTIAQKTQPQQQEPFPITWIIASAAIIIVGVVAVLVYFKKIKK